MRWAVLFLFHGGFVAAHMSLTNPPARYPPLDFLDSARTKGPCGVPRPRSAEFTPYAVDEKVNVTWRMQYPHQGGFRIRLLDHDGRELEYLTNNGTYFVGMEDQTSQSVEVVFKKPCRQCTLLLERQALEWGLSYTFRSCADINVEKALPKDEDACSQRGTPLADDSCDCNRGWEGDKCQFKVECKKDGDCGPAGLCVQQPGQLIRKICACPYGFFGTHCQRKFPGKTNDCVGYDSLNNDKFSQYGMFNPECYNAKELPNNDTIYFRKSDKDVEIILDMATTSWLALGWRPLELSPTCRLFPDLEGVSRKKRSANETILPEESLIEDPTFLDAPETAEQEGPAPKLPENNGFLRGALDAPLHAMDCVDLVTAAVIDGRLLIRDMYSRDRSTPLDDLWYEGEDSLVGAAGIEVDGRTVVMFRRWSQEIEPTDHPLGPGPMHVIWAKGQTQGSYSHAAPSALTGSRHTNSMFYPDDFLKYHGNVNRGQTVLDFHVSVPGRPEEDTKELIETIMEEEKPLTPARRPIARPVDNTENVDNNLLRLREDPNVSQKEPVVEEVPGNDVEKNLVDPPSPQAPGSAKSNTDPGNSAFTLPRFNLLPIFVVLLYRPL